MCGVWLGVLSRVVRVVCTIAKLAASSSETAIFPWTHFLS